MEEDNSVETTDKPQMENPFLRRLHENQVETTKKVILRTVCQDPDQTIGSILDALENPGAKAGDYLMLEFFRRFTFREVAEAIVSSGGVKAASPSSAPPPQPPSVSEDENEEEDDLEGDEDEFDEDEEGDEAEEDGDPEKKEVARLPPKKKAKEKKGKKGKGGKKGKKEKKGGKNSKPASQTNKGLSEKAIMACLKSNGATDEESAMTSSEIRKVLGGASGEFRQHIDSLKEQEKVDSTGKARGTKYFLL